MTRDDHLEAIALACESMMGELKTIAGDLESIARNVRELQGETEQPEPGPGEPPTPPPDERPLTPEDSLAVARLRTGERVQLVPRRRGSWRVDWRERNNKGHLGAERPTIQAALAWAESQSTFPNLPGETPLSVSEESAVVDLGALGDRGACSVRWEGRRRGTHADHNWHPSHPSNKWTKQGLIVEPVEWLQAERRKHGD